MNNKKTRTVSMHPQELESRFGVSQELILKAINTKDLVLTVNGVSLTDFRKWCKSKNIPCSKAKKCSTCEEFRPAYVFALNHSTADGLNCYCDKCMDTVNKRYKAYKPSDGSLFPKTNTDTMIALSSFSQRYNLSNEETIRLYVFFTGEEVAGKNLRRDTLIDESKAERCLISFLAFKRCSHCGRILRSSEFRKDETKWQNLQSWCGQCQKAYSIEKRENKREQAKAESELDALLQKYPSLKDKLKSA